MSDVLSLDQIKKAAGEATLYTDVDVPEWDGKVRLTKLPYPLGMKMSLDHAALQKRAGDEAARLQFYITFLKNCISDAAGNLIFSDSHDAVPSAGEGFLMTQPFGVINRLALAGLRFNGIIDDEEEADSKKARTRTSPSPSA